MCSAKIVFEFLGFRFVLNLRDPVQVPSSSIQCNAAETKPHEETNEIEL
jgi:hypothetical protein